jgi:hypothetical protein
VPALSVLASDDEAPAVKVSASLYTTWLRCPAQAQARLDGHYQADTVDQFRGLLAHRVFARHLNDGPIRPADFEQACREEIGGSQLNWKLAGLGLRTAELRRVFAEVEQLYARWRQLKPVGAGEVHLQFELEDDLVFVGTVDCVSGSPDAPRLVDWKTGELGEAEHQLGFYAWLWWTSGRAMPLAVEAVSVTTGERFERWVDRKWIAAVELDVVTMVADLRSGSTPATPGPFCRWCPILADCEPGTRATVLLDV